MRSLVPLYAGCVHNTDAVEWIRINCLKCVTSCVSQAVCWRADSSEVLLISWTYLQKSCRNPIFFIYQSVGLKNVFTIGWCTLFLSKIPTKQSFLNEYISKIMQWSPVFIRNYFVLPFNLAKVGFEPTISWLQVQCSTSPVLYQCGNIN